MPCLYAAPADATVLSKSSCSLVQFPKCMPSLHTEASGTPTSKPEVRNVHPGNHVAETPIVPSTALFEPVELSIQAASCQSADTWADSFSASPKCSNNPSSPTPISSQGDACFTRLCESVHFAMTVFKSARSSYEHGNSVAVSVDASTSSLL